MIECIALSDTIPSRDLPAMKQGKPVQVTDEQYKANKDVLKRIEKRGRKAKKSESD